MVCTARLLLDVFLRDIATWVNPRLGGSGTLCRLDILQSRESNSAD